MTVINANKFLIVVVGIAVPGTAEQVAEHFIPDGYGPVTVKARLANSGTMYFADSQTNAQTSANRKALEAGESTTFNIDKTSLLWFDADNTSDRAEISVHKPLG